MYDDILLPTDGSPGMSSVVDHAVSLAETHDATVHGLYVVDTVSLADVPMETTLEGVNRALREEGEAAMEDLQQRADGVDVETTIIEGSPSREIVHYAEDTSCDVVVMGTHGRDGVSRLLLGSVAERVVRSSPVPVLTIRVGDEPPDLDEM
ncbi:MULTISPECIES: universal stress protein [Salinibaculum]|uniref:universal stress protein n=1 Tax=Salinibaculum TaxID=2732368 RepID=UPI0030CCC27C